VFSEYCITPEGQNKGCWRSKISCYHEELRQIL
jgi:hypothetical protein